MEVMKFKEGTLPTKYLGVPLITKKLGVNDCKSLIDKIKGRTKDWKYKYLSYAGRLMLIAAVLESISMYWASVFKLPKTVIKEINGILKKYMWSNGDSAKGKAKVAWKKICKPREFGGLGIKDLEKWNATLLDNVYMWYDKWHESDILIDKVTNRELYDARIPKMISISSMMNNRMRKKVWNEIARKMNLQKVNYKWDDIVNELTGKKNGNNIWSAMRRLSLAAVVYYIWQERNQRIFKGSKRGEATLIDTINEIIKLKLMSIKVKNSNAVKRVAEI
ncbi:hypothetical protein Tco_1099210 [Tanacetum coccineum]